MQHSRRQILSMIAGLTSVVGFRPSKALAMSRTPPLPDGPDVILRADTSAGALSLLDRYQPRPLQAPEKRFLCQTSDHVIAALRHLDRTNTPFALRAGGHCFAGFSHHDVAVIDVRGLDRLVLDPGTGIAECGPGVPLGTLHLEAAAHGFAVPAGWCASVAVGGHVLGGGVGYTARAHGLFCDALTAIELIDARGRMITASADENADLFWAARGGGGDLGVVTKFTFALPAYKASDGTDTISWFDMTRRLAFDSAARFLSAWQNWAATADRRLTSHCTVQSYPDGDFLIRVVAQMLDTGAALLAELERAPALFTTLRAGNVFVGTLSEGLTERILDDPSFDTHTHVKSDFLPAPQNPAACSALLAPLAAQPAGSLDLILEAMGGAVADTPVTDTAYPHRDAAFLLQLSGRESAAQDRDVTRSRLHTVWQAWRPLVTGGAYVNYRDPDLPDFATAYWGDNLDRLSKIKRRIDPNGRFKHPQSIPA